MSDAKLFAGHAVRRIRRANDLTQAAMAEALGISPSYLNLIERNQRPMTGKIILALAQQYDFDPRSLTGAAPGGGVDALRRRLNDPRLADIELDKAQIEDWVAVAPGTAEAFARIFDTQGGDDAPLVSDPQSAVRREIERWRNHFADLDLQAEALADELRLRSGDLYGAITEYLRVNHQLSIRILPAEVMPDLLRRLDLHARQLQLSEMLDPASRTFAAAYQLAQLTATKEIDALVKGTEFTEGVARRFYRRHLTSYFAAALMMPYARFLRACDNSGYDIALLQRRFGAGFEQVAHRLTTLQRVGARGLPFFMIRIDRAGQSSKRYAGASKSPLVDGQGRCPLWQLHHAFDQPGRLVTQLVEIEDGKRWFTLARTVEPQIARAGAIVAEFTVGLGLEASLADRLAVARGVDLQAAGSAINIGLGCRQCTRSDCAQRSAAPAGRSLIFDERERGLTPFRFAGDPD
ncbi:MAG: short-chain fatty acyl-CoA regulator family protein [Sphingorhabdus sp.]